MRPFPLAPVALAAALGLAAHALAQSVAMPPHPDINTTGFSGDAATLSSAVKAIEAVSAGKVVEIRYNNVAGTPGYDVVLERGSEVGFVRFTKPGEGPVAMTTKREPQWMLDWQGRRDVDLVSKAKVSLADAIATAEAAVPGAPAVAAGIAKSASNASSSVHAYNVAVLQDGGLRRVAVDCDSGQVIQDPQALTGW